MKTLSVVLLAFGLTVPLGAVDWNDPKNVVESALASNPSIARAEAELEAARERVGPAASLPNPMVMGGVQNLEVDLSEDEMMTMYMVGASQKLTRGSKRTAARRAEEAAVRAAESRLQSLRAEIERDVLFAYYDVASADDQIRTIEQVRGAVEAIVDAARVRYEVGSSVQADVIRAQLEKSNLEHQLIALRGQRASATARLVALTGGGFEIPTLSLPHASAGREVGPLVLPDAHPALEAARAEIAGLEQRIELAKLQTKPDLTVEAQYGLRREQTDMVSVVASVELPFRRDELIEPRVREAVALRNVAQQRLEEIRRSLVRDLAVAATIHDEMNHQFHFHQEVLVPQARLALDSTLASYQTGKTTFDSILGAETTYLRLQLQYFDYLGRHLKAVIDYEALQRGARSTALSGGGTAALSPSEPSSSGSSGATMNAM
jgi:outer membrane protein TolC